MRGITAPKKRKGPPFGSPFDSRLYRTLGRRPGSVGADPGHQTGNARANLPLHRVSYSVKYYRLCHLDDVVAKPQHKPRKSRGSGVPRSKPPLRTGALLTPRCRYIRNAPAFEDYIAPRQMDGDKLPLVLFNRTVGKPQHDLQWIKSPRASNLLKKKRPRST